ncbi:NAD(P)-binding domain-containing protein [Dickeya dadantii]|uniref:NADPH-dependent F420 reductase n=1 Tax=Dickeya dadantii TaxID=204038 RepID=UPI001CF0F405|nr:NAD(P)-binding domain-containing protein [Dickeya dadantii]MCA7011617.1 NAD(P)-binding domain-containing protein [Dickeya dadantii]
MTIGIIGAGSLGINLSRAFANHGIEAILAGRQGPQALAGLIEELGPGIQAGTVDDAARQNIVVLAVRWEQIDATLADLPKWDGRILIDPTNPVVRVTPGSPDADPANNPLAPYGIKALDLGNSHSSAQVRARVPGARLVKAFNHFPVELLLQPQTADGQRVLFYSGDDADARADVRALIEKIGFFPADLGALDVGGPLASMPFGSLAGGSFVRA